MRRGECRGKKRTKESEENRKRNREREVKTGRRGRGEKKTV